MNVLCVDPGDTTGIFLFYDGSSSVFQPEDFYTADLIAGILDNMAMDHIVIESFNLYDTRTKANAQMALNIIGTTRYEGFKRDISVTMQPNRDKNQVTDSMLEEKGFLTRPKKPWRHANDAARHYVYFMNRKGKR